MKHEPSELTRKALIRKLRRYLGSHGAKINFWNNKVSKIRRAAGHPTGGPFPTIRFLL